MANTIEEMLLLFGKQTTYNDYKDLISDEALAFISEKGKEKLVTQREEFTFVPGGGTEGQVIKKGVGNVYWADLSGVYIQNDVVNLRNDVTYYIANITREKQTIALTNDMSKGQTIQVLMRTDLDAATVEISEDWVSLNGLYTINMVKDEWTMVKLLCDGSKIYIEFYNPGSSLDNALFVTGDRDGQILVNNGTLQIKNENEFVVGRFNNSSRESSNTWGIANTLFTVGNGLDADHRHDAFRVMQSGEVYVPDTSSSQNYYSGTDYICLQSAIKSLQDNDASHDSSISSIKTDVANVQKDLTTVPHVTSTASSKDLEITDKQGNTIVTFADGHIKTKNFDSSTIVQTDATQTESGLMSATDKTKLDAMPLFWTGTQEEYDQIDTKDSNTFYFIENES